MKSTFFCLFLQLFLSFFTFAQDVIEWSPNYKVIISDFQSKSTQIGNVNQYSILLATHMDFSFYMSTYEFMLTKNFNSKVATTFTRTASVLIAPDSSFAQKLVKYAQLNFDLTELYARKFRKKLFKNKGVLSDVNFFQEAYKPIEIEYNARIAEIGKLTDLGQSETRIEEAHQQILKEIEELPDFCKTCKPKKKKK